MYNNEDNCLVKTIAWVEFADRHDLCKSNEARQKVFYIAKTWLLIKIKFNPVLDYHWTALRVLPYMLLIFPSVFYSEMFQWTLQSSAVFELTAYQLISASNPAAFVRSLSLIVSFNFEQVLFILYLIHFYICSSCQTSANDNQ